MKKQNKRRLGWLERVPTPQEVEVCIMMLEIDPLEAADMRRAYAEMRQERHEQNVWTAIIVLGSVFVGLLYWLT